MKVLKVRTKHSPHTLADDVNVMNGLIQERIDGITQLLPEGTPGGAPSVRDKYTSDIIPHISLGSVSNYDAAIKLVGDLNEAGVLAGTRIVLDKAQTSPIQSRRK